MDTESILMIARWEEGVWEWVKGTWNKKHTWQVQNRQGEVKNSIGNGET